MRFRFRTAVGLVAAVAASGGTRAAEDPASPASLGFAEFYKCPDSDVVRLGDTGTPKLCLAACEAHVPAAGCWWLDGTGGFPRECRLCRTGQPAKRLWPNDWGLPMSRPVA